MWAGAGLEGESVCSASGEDGDPLRDKVDRIGGESVSPLCRCVAPEGVMVLGDLLERRILLVNVLARYLSSSWWEIGVSKCELSRCNAVREERRRGIGTCTELTRLRSTGEGALSAEAFSGDVSGDLGGEVEKGSRVRPL